MKCLRKRSGFTLIELLVVILILAILMAIALPLYLRAVRDSERQTCRSNMQTIAVACQAYKVRNPVHLYPGDPGSGGGALDLSLLVNANPSSIGETADLQALPRCPADTTPGSPDYAGVQNADGTITISCICDDGGGVGAVAGFHNQPGANGAGFTPGMDSQ
jgi:prepilin-type N-terminal cleavage/methylation domain-containing protein